LPFTDNEPPATKIDPRAPRNPRLPLFFALN